MHSSRSSLVGVVIVALALAGCGKTPATTTGKVIKITEGPDAAKQAQKALIEVKPGEVVEFGPGKFVFTATLSCDKNNITIRGAGQDKTILSFNQQGQGTGGEGILITSKEKVTIEDLAVEDAKGDGIKVNGCDGITFRKVRTSWTDGQKETNGGYGLYPVLSKNVLIEDCIARDASDAGIYVGQSENIIVRRNIAENNVAGIEIENSYYADVYENTATHNTGGILVFSLPELPKKNGHHCRVYNNTIVDNNHENFAPKGNTVAGVPAGTGVMIMANKQVEVFDNKIENNQSASLSIISYLASQKPFKDPGYDPYCDSIYVHDNKFVGGGDKPSGKLPTLISALTEDGKVPTIVYDGIIDKSKVVDGTLPEKLAIRIRDNGEATFMNLNLESLDLSNPLALKKEREKVSSDLKPYAGEIPKLSPVKIAGVK